MKHSALVVSLTVLSICVLAYLTGIKIPILDDIIAFTTWVSIVVLKIFSLFFTALILLFIGYFVRYHLRKLKFPKLFSEVK
jgi:uncharacterized membrane protein